jgi:regulator of nucleoside diphosphate kinase
MNRKVLLGDPPPIRITGSDLGRLDTLVANLSRSSSSVVRFLERELERARLADPGEATPFVRMHSRIRFADGDGAVRTAILVYPEELSATPDGLSILTPVGTALLGLAEGQTISYETRDGRIKTLAVLEIVSTA